jgi:formate dehydrogenase subunit delta
MTPKHLRSGDSADEASHPPEPQQHRRESNLIKMANDIGHFFAAEADPDEAVRGIAAHIGKFWTRKMRARLVALVNDADCGLEPLPLQAARRLAATQD